MRRDENKIRSGTVSKRSKTILQSDTELNIVETNTELDRLLAV